MPPPTDQLADLDRLAPGVARRDEAAMTELYELLAPTLLGLAHGLLRDRALAEDVVQDAFVRLVDEAPRLRAPDGRGLRAWLARTVRNRCLDHLRSGRHRMEQSTARMTDHKVSLSEPAGPSEPVPTSDPVMPQDPTITAALQTLTTDQRQALLLFHVVGLSGREVGEALGRSRAAVYTLLRRAERGMREALTSVGPSTPASDRGTDDRPHHGRSR